MVDHRRLVAVILEVADLDRSTRLYREAFGVDLEPGDNGVDDRWIGGEHGLVPTAKVRGCEVDGTGLAKTVKAPRKALPADVERHVRRRDLHCRVEDCTAPADEIHHMYPVAEFGETTDVHTLVGVCTPDHRLLPPHGPYMLVGDPEQPEPLRLVHRDDLPPDEQSRDGPSP